MFEILTNEILKDDVIEAMFGVICGDNEALRNMFTLGVDTVVREKTFWGCKSTNQIVRSNRLVNYFGLLEGHLLNGDVIAEMSAGVLS